MELISLPLVLLLILNTHSEQTKDVKLTLTVQPQTSVFIGDTVTLTCEVHQSNGWQFIFINGSNTDSTETTGAKIIRSVQVFDGGEYKCRAGRGNPQGYTQYSDPVTVTVQKRPTPQVSVDPADHVFRGETVNLRCVINGGGVSSWQYSWYKDSIIQQNKLQSYTIRSVTESDAGKYTCRGNETSGSRYSHISNAVTLTVSALPRATVIVTPDRSVFTGETVTLKCEIEDQDRSLNWRYRWYKGRNASQSQIYTVNRDSFTINGVTRSDQNHFSCRAEIHGRSQTLLSSSDVYLTVNALPRVTVRVTPYISVFTGETVTLKCEIEDQYRSLNWTYRWYRDTTWTSVFEGNIYTIRSPSDQDEFWCRGQRDGRPSSSQYSDHVTLSVKALPRATVRVTPDRSVFTGETVTLKCDIGDQYRSLNWRYMWYKDTTAAFNSERYTVNRDYLTITGVTQSDQWFWCSAEIHGRPKTLLSSSPVYLTLKGSKPKPEFTSDTEGSLLTGVSPSVSLIIRPNRSQHFSSESLSLSCEDHSNSTGWTVRRYTDKLKPCSSSDTRSTGTTSTCTIRSLITSDTGVYWCQSESGEKLHPVNISVHNVDVILDSPVHSVTKGDNLTLRCLYRDKNPSNLRAEFYKDGSVVQNQTTGDMMIIPTVSKSHEGFYYCKHPERGESPKSWISVRGDTFICSWTMSYRGLIAGIVVGVSVMFLSIYLLLWSNKKKKGSAYALKENTSEGDDIMYSKLKKGEDQDVAFGSSDVTNAQKK